jgi:hypothetical protein
MRYQPMCKSTLGLQRARRDKKKTRREFDLCILKILIVALGTACRTEFLLHWPNTKKKSSNFHDLMWLNQCTMQLSVSSLIERIIAKTL